MQVWALTLIANVYVGIAERALELAVEQAARRTSIAIPRGTFAHHPLVQHQVADMYLALDGRPLVRRRGRVRLGQRGRPRADVGAEGAGGEVAGHGGRESLCVTRFLFGAGEAGCFPNLTKAFTTWLPENERVRAQGIMWLSARWGGAFTPPLVASVMQLRGLAPLLRNLRRAGRDLGRRVLPLVSQQPAGQSEAQCGGAGTGARMPAPTARPHGDVPWAQVSWHRGRCG